MLIFNFDDFKSWMPARDTCTFVLEKQLSYDQINDTVCVSDRSLTLKS